MNKQICEPLNENLNNMSVNDKEILRRDICEIIGKQNLIDLENIREIILIEENSALEFDEVLSRVICNYKKSINI
jgi:hypothetical protein